MGFDRIELSTPHVTLAYSAFWIGKKKNTWSHSLARSMPHYHYTKRFWSHSIDYQILNSMLYAFDLIFCGKRHFVSVGFFLCDRACFGHGHRSWRGEDMTRTTPNCAGHDKNRWLYKFIYVHGHGIIKMKYVCNSTGQRTSHFIVRIVLLSLVYNNI